METINKILAEFHVGPITRALLLVIIGIFLSRLLSASINKALRRRLRPHKAMIVRRILFYFVLILFLISAVQELGFNISALLGATGILTVALGIASQTSMSNVVSGIFIIGEKPFEIGDTIKVNDMQGEVLSIDFLSVKIRTNNNTMIRIPNEVLIKSAITNVSYFALRRVDLILGISYRESLNVVRKVLLKVANDNPLCLDEPQPYIGVDGFGESTVNVQFYVWGKKGDYNELKSSIQADIKKAFKENDIEMPFPSRTLYLSGTSAPLPIKIISENK